MATIRKLSASIRAMTASKAIRQNRKAHYWKEKQLYIDQYMQKMIEPIALRVAEILEKKQKEKEK